ncbi:MAG: hypothetical protein COA54_08815 [Thiotrichaceae bacterium]|nr:MAG: hypothetical protein COA54_08815 [Thiotrichaceae bacterium]
MKKFIVALFAIATFAISGCSDNEPTTIEVDSSTLSGTAARGAPIEGTVTVKGAAGNELDIVTGTNGSFTINVLGLTAPFMLKVMPSDGTETFYSFATASGQTVNITQATNLVLFLAGNEADLAAIYNNWDGTAFSAAEVTTAEALVRANLETQMTAAGLDVSAFNIFSTAFSADSTGFDAVLDNLAITVDGVNGTFTFDAGNGTPFDNTLAPPAPANAISIITASGGQHVLNGIYRTDCYNSGGIDGRIDTVTITGTTWVNSSVIYGNDDTCQTLTASGAVTATMVKGADKSISGWLNGGDVAPAAEGGGVLSDTETVTAFTLTVTAVNDPGDALYGGNISLGLVAPSFYVFDDTNSPDTFKMWRDKDGDSASASDPFIIQE